MIALRWGRQRRDLPLRQSASARWLPWVLALMVYLAGLGGVGLTLLHDTLRAARGSLAASLTLLVPAEASPARLETVLAVLRQTRGIVSARPLPPAEVARLLEPWLGSSVVLAELPVPRLIDIRVEPDGGTDFAVLRQHLASVVPGAHLEDYQPWLAGMRAAARRVDGVLVAAIVVALLLMAVSAGFAARFDLVAQRSVIELLLLLGADDGDIAHPLAMRSLRLGLWGGALGAAGVLLTTIALGDAGSLIRSPAPPAAIGIADWRLWAILVGAVVAAGLIAMASARATVLRRLARMV